jgi:Flp pilus assembly pilin Flp
MCDANVPENADHGEAGATAVEYALMVTFIAIAIIGAVTLLGAKLSGFFNDGCVAMFTSC